jgi:hypothetical protein
MAKAALSATKAAPVPSSLRFMVSPPKKSEPMFGRARLWCQPRRDQFLSRSRQSFGKSTLFFLGSVLVAVSQPERAAFREVVNVGFKDAFWLFNQPEKQFTWRLPPECLPARLGLRIDHILLSPQLAAVCKACGIDTGPRKRERPSDHARVTAEL